MKKFVYEYQGLFVIAAFVIIVVCFALYNNKKYPHLKPGQEMRCDYDGCVIVDKAKPIHIDRMTNMSGYNTGQ